MCEQQMPITVRDTLYNRPVVGADITVAVVTEAGELVVFQDKTEGDGILEVPVEGTNTYKITVAKEGYITVTIVYDVDLHLGNCEVPLSLLVPLDPPITCEGGVKVSLTWDDQPQDLDLYSWKVGQNDTTNRYITISL